MPNCTASYKIPLFLSGVSLSLPILSLTLSASISDSGRLKSIVSWLCEHTTKRLTLSPSLHDMFLSLSLSDPLRDDATQGCRKETERERSAIGVPHRDWLVCRTGTVKGRFYWDWRKNISLSLLSFSVCTQWLCFSPSNASGLFLSSGTNLILSLSKLKHRSHCSLHQFRYCFRQRPRSNCFTYYEVSYVATVVAENTKETETERDI